MCSVSWRSLISGRHDLGHVDPADLTPDAMGDGEEEGKLPPAPMPATAIASPGFARNTQLGNLYVVRGGAATVRAGQAAEALTAEADAEPETMLTTETEIVATEQIAVATNGSGRGRQHVDLADHVRSRGSAHERL